MEDQSIRYLKSVILVLVALAIDLAQPASFAMFFGETTSAWLAGVWSEAMMTGAFFRPAEVRGAVLSILQNRLSNLLRRVVGNDDFIRFRSIESRRILAPLDFSVLVKRFDESPAKMIPAFALVRSEAWVQVGWF